MDTTLETNLPYSVQSNWSNLKLTNEQKAIWNALGLDEKSSNSSVNADLLETLYKQNISLFSIKDTKLISSMLIKKSTQTNPSEISYGTKDSTLSTNFKTQHLK